MFSYLIVTKSRYTSARQHMVVLVTKKLHCTKREDQLSCIKLRGAIAHQIARLNCHEKAWSSCEVNGHAILPSSRPDQTARLNGHAILPSSIAQAPSNCEAQLSSWAQLLNCQLNQFVFFLPLFLALGWGVPFGVAFITFSCIVFFQVIFKNIFWK